MKPMSHLADLEAKPRRSQSPELPPTAAVAGVVSPSRARAEKAEARGCAERKKRNTGLRRHVLGF